ncbi:putative transmembrane protein [Sesbania bispinosa]|nr:putative transmembrane protein [Sesbania bispinosa]
MDREQEEMQFLGLFGVYKESYKIIVAWRKIFSQITLTLILPLSFIFLIHIEVSNVLFRKIAHNTQQIMETPQGTPQYHNLSDMISSEWATFWLFKLIYYTFFLIFSLLSTSAVVYTIASIYTARDVTFSRVMSVVPKVWKRLMVTFLCTFMAFFAYNVMAILVVIIWALTIGGRSGGVAMLVVIGILYFAGLVYLTVIWQLASVVTVLEDSYGVQAMMKSNELIKGKMGLSIVIFFMLNVCFFVIQFLFTRLVVRGWRVDSVDRTAYGILCFLLLSHLFLFGLVIQTVLYFVCKSYHHQNIDKSALSDHLEVYHGEYEPLKAKDVQLEQYHV